MFAAKNVLVLAPYLNVDGALAPFVADLLVLTAGVAGLLCWTYSKRFGTELLVVSWLVAMYSGVSGQSDKFFLSVWVLLSVPVVCCLLYILIMSMRPNHDPDT